MIGKGAHWRKLCHDEFSKIEGQLLKWPHVPAVVKEPEGFMRGDYGIWEEEKACGTLQPAFELTRKSSNFSNGCVWICMDLCF